MAHQPITPANENTSSYPVASKPSQSLGKWIDNLLGDKKARQKAAVKAAARQKAAATEH